MRHKYKLGQKVIYFGNEYEATEVIIINNKKIKYKISKETPTGEITDVVNEKDLRRAKTD